MKVETVLNGLDRLVDLVIDPGKNVVFVTGGALSSASGLPPFREIGTATVSFGQFGDSWWNRKKFDDDPLSWWNSFWHKLYWNSGSPNTGHNALKHIVTRFSGNVVVTQSIDGLHHKSGLKDEKLVEVYGRVGKFRCLGICKGALLDLENIKNEGESKLVEDEVTKNFKTVPVCSQCGGRVLPNVRLSGEEDTEFILDGETVLKDQQMQRAASWIKSANAIVFIGSSTTGIFFTILKWIENIMLEKSKPVPELFLLGTRSIKDTIFRAGKAESFKNIDRISCQFAHLQGRPEQTLSLFAATTDHIDGIDAMPTSLAQPEYEWDHFAPENENHKRSECRKVSKAFADLNPKDTDAANKLKNSYASWMGGSSSSEFYDSNEENKIQEQVEKERKKKLNKMAKKFGLYIETTNFWTKEFEKSNDTKRRSPNSIRPGHSPMSLLIPRSALPEKVNKDIGQSVDAPEWAKGKKKIKIKTEPKRKRSPVKRKKPQEKTKAKTTKKKKKKRKNSDGSEGPEPQKGKNQEEGEAADILASMFGS
mmetsp:Transcript_15131/g.19472  ORF Transcript_15131/g.19472 Transcript_15131/m.19472 type:complete len:536 (+) Transcript_15131:102-1709(+)|eukprot:CAMPEP_0204862096 /NCGR_PEP_ID=MMETSP1348-20121228/2190_1 /ASSEMBLY_ACC=CAM_ASM_000700 /TAXON_ID=215587 /ORGANISM="Aplanochytrium stocchinoi, Strain GSBS06" /LENGTH=535 /DNA_ID=CAMNT_0052011845 /DNA_START=105 /DNA_END=1712 /DNA_ORIENTATION=+